MLNAEQTTSHSTASYSTSRGTKVALWWLRNYETIIHFWTGFSWAWVIGVILCAITGYLDLRYALCFMFLIGVVANAGVYFSIKTMANYLKALKDGPEKKEAHALMIKIIKRRMLNAH